MSTLFWEYGLRCCPEMILFTTAAQRSKQEGITATRIRHRSTLEYRRLLKYLQPSPCLELQQVICSFSESIFTLHRLRQYDQRIAAGGSVAGSSSSNTAINCLSSEADDSSASSTLGGCTSGTNSTADGGTCSICAAWLKRQCIACQLLTS